MSMPLSPMLVQYLVGLCCLRWGRENVDVTLGDFVMDQAAEKERDVDVTVRVKGSDAEDYLFIGYEVKREARPLDVAVVEQLGAKLADMAEISHKAIVSSSGYTAAARKKAVAHGVSLYQIIPWSEPIGKDFSISPNVNSAAVFKIQPEQFLLTWVEESLSFSLICRQASGGFSVDDSAPIYNKKMKPHKKFADFLEFKKELLLRSTEYLLDINISKRALVDFNQAQTVYPEAGDSPPWPQAHTLETSTDDAFIEVNGALVRIDNLTIEGCLQWRKSSEKVLSYVMVNVETGEPFSGAIIFLGSRPGQMVAVTAAPNSRDLHFNFVQLSDTQQSVLKRVPVRHPPADARED